MDFIINDLKVEKKLKKNKIVARHLLIAT